METTLQSTNNTKLGLLCTAGLLGLLALIGLGDKLSVLSGGNLPASLISVARNRALMTLADDSNYYETVEKRGLEQVWQFKYSRDFRFFRYAPNQTWEKNGITTNSLGRVGPEWPKLKPAHTIRIALLGDSLAAGYRVPYQETFAPRLEQHLNQAGSPYPVEVLNFACPGYTLPQVFDTAIEDVRPYGADVYLLELSERSLYRQWDNQLLQLTQRGIDPKYDFLRKFLQQAHVSRSDSRVELHTKLAPYRIPILRSMLEALNVEVRGRHATLVLLLFPAVEPGDLSARRIHAAQGAYEGLNVPVIDLTDSFDKTSNRQPFLAAPDDPSNLDVHPNGPAFALILDDLYRKLQAQPDAMAAMTGHEPADAPITK